ncbi:MAG: hypothetical protein IIB90_17475 [Gemmatimonadetes bacterium]|nr:hypothetical protein [Gemmatimonadota bacterium]
MGTGYRQPIALRPELDLFLWDREIPEVQLHDGVSAPLAVFHQGAQPPSAVPSGKPGSKRARIRLAVEPSSMVGPARGCPFAPRCPEVQDICRHVAPALERKAANHIAACHLR